MVDPMANGSRFPRGTLPRPEYQPGAYLLADDLKAGQQYLQQRFRRHLRRLHNWGVACGMRVIPANDPAHPWGVYVCPGYAIGPYGDEIQLAQRTLLDITEFLWRRSLLQDPPSHAYVGIRYAEDSIKPVPTPVAVCRCEDTVYTASRISDGYDLAALWAFPADERQGRFEMCGQSMPFCSSCPPSPYVLLARVKLPASEGVPIVAADISTV